MPTDRTDQLIKRFESRPILKQGLILLEAARQMNNAPEDELLTTHWTDYLENALDLYKDYGDD